MSLTTTSLLVNKVSHFFFPNFPIFFFCFYTFGLLSWTRSNPCTGFFSKPGDFRYYRIGHVKPFLTSYWLRQNPKYLVFYTNSGYLRFFTKPAPLTVCKHYFNQLPKYTAVFEHSFWLILLLRGGFGQLIKISSFCTLYRIYRNFVHGWTISASTQLRFNPFRLSHPRRNERVGLIAVNNHVV